MENYLVVSKSDLIQRGEAVRDGSHRFPTAFVFPDIQFFEVGEVPRNDQYFIVAVVVIP